MKPLLAIVCLFLPACSVTGNNNHVATSITAHINVSVVPPSEQILSRQ